MKTLFGRVISFLCLILAFSAFAKAESWSELSNEKFSPDWWSSDFNNSIKDEVSANLIDPPPAEPTCGCVFAPTPIGYTSIVSANECVVTPYPQCVLETCVVAVYDDEDNFIRRTTYYCSAFGPAN